MAAALADQRSWLFSVSEASGKITEDLLESTLKAKYRKLKTVDFLEGVIPEGDGDFQVQIDFGEKVESTRPTTQLKELFKTTKVSVKRTPPKKRSWRFTVHGVTREVVSAVSEEELLPVVKERYRKVEQLKIHTRKQDGEGQPHFSVDINFGGPQPCPGPTKLLREYFECTKVTAMPLDMKRGRQPNSKRRDNGNQHNHVGAGDQSDDRPDDSCEEETDSSTGTFESLGKPSNSNGDGSHNHRAGLSRSQGTEGGAAAGTRTCQAESTLLKVDSLVFLSENKGSKGSLGWDSMVRHIGAGAQPESGHSLDFGPETHSPGGYVNIPAMTTATVFDDGGGGGLSTHMMLAGQVGLAPVPVAGIPPHPPYGGKLCPPPPRAVDPMAVDPSPDVSPELRVQNWGVIVEPSPRECNFDGQPFRSGNQGHRPNGILTRLNFRGLDLSLRWIPYADVLVNFVVDGAHNFEKKAEALKAGAEGFASADIEFPSMALIWQDLYRAENIKIVQWYIPLPLQVDVEVMIVSMATDYGRIALKDPNMKIMYKRDQTSVDYHTAIDRAMAARTAAEEASRRGSFSFFAGFGSFCTPCGIDTTHDELEGNEDEDDTFMQMRM
ncbi:unnamed protein product [Discosporangium mesarthrocarpum]